MVFIFLCVILTVVTDFSFVSCVFTDAQEVVPGLDASALVFTLVRGTSADKELVSPRSTCAVTGTSQDTKF